MAVMGRVAVETVLVPVFCLQCPLVFVKMRPGIGSTFLNSSRIYLIDLAVADVTISVGLIVVVPVVVPVALVGGVVVLVVMGIPMRVAVVAMAAQELGCDSLNQQDEKES